MKRHECIYGFYYCLEFAFLADRVVVMQTQITIFEIFLTIHIINEKVCSLFVVFTNKTKKIKILIDKY